MNNTQHTPGPLDNVTGYKPGPWIRQVLNDESEAYIHDKHCNAIARVYSLSDAALIAAAPAMYEALKLLTRVVQSYENPMNIVTSAQLDALKAIAIAEGREHV